MPPAPVVSVNEFFSKEPRMLDARTETKSCTPTNEYRLTKLACDKSNASANKVWDSPSKRILVWWITGNRTVSADHLKL